MSLATTLLGERWGSIRVLTGGWAKPRPKPCKACGGRYRARQVIRRASWKLGQPREPIGLCPLWHATPRLLQ